MRKNLTKAISTTLAAAMVVTAGGFAGVANTNGSTAKAADPTASAAATNAAVSASPTPTAVPSATPATSYMAYTAFSMAGPWIYRSEWTNVNSGLNVKEFYNETFTKKTVPYDYKTQYIANNLTIAQKAAGVGKMGLAALQARIHSEATFKDATMTQNGEQTVEVLNLDASQYENTKKDEGGAWYDVLHISTDIPMTMKNVTCTNVKVYVDDKLMVETKEAPANQQESDGSGSGNRGYYDFMIIDNYAENHGIKGKTLDATTTKKVNGKDTVVPVEGINTMPTKSLKITYTISGVDFKAEKKDPVVENGPVVGASFTDNGLKYTVTKRTKTDGSKGAVSVVGLAKSAANVTIPATAKTTQGTTALNYDVTAVEDSAFAKNKTIKTVKLGSAVKKVGEAAFKGCTKLTKVTYNSKVTSIASETFSGCTSLKSFKLSSKIKSVGSSAFSGCKKLSKFTYNSTVKSVAGSTFKNCTSLKSIKLGKKVKKIGASAFAGCKKLSKITVSQKVKVSKKAFKGCKKTIKVSGKKAYVKYTKAQIKKAGYKKVK